MIEGFQLFISSECLVGLTNSPGSFLAKASILWTTLEGDHSRVKKFFRIGCGSTDHTTIIIIIPPVTKVYILLSHNY